MTFLNLPKTQIDGLKTSIGIMPRRVNNRLGILLYLNIRISFTEKGHLTIFRISTDDIIGLIR